LQLVENQDGSGQGAATRDQILAQAAVPSREGQILLAAGESSPEVGKPAEQNAGDQQIKGKDGEVIRKTVDGKYFVTGPDGKEREFVTADDCVQQPGKPTRWPLDGGAIDNQSDKPILVLGKGLGHPDNPHGDGYLRIVKPHTKTDGSQTDYDGIVTDKRFQPVVLPDGKVLMPAKVDPDAEWLKVPDRNTGVVTNSETRVDRPWLPPKGETGTFKISDYTGGGPVTPETPEIRKRDEQAQREKNEEKAREEYERTLRKSQHPDPGKI